METNILLKVRVLAIIDSPVKLSFAIEHNVNQRFLFEY